MEKILVFTTFLLAQKGMYDKVIPIGPPPLQQSMEFLVEQNVPIFVCKPCFEFRCLVSANLVATAQLKGMDHFVQLSKERKVVSF